ncbi:hypothetical protein SSX86_012764 [Deinandra increscens subsp. villosa]|uniref:Methyltransferase type 11 domain-containing protein n=1 Tax=Deinandra increscens subsp. villosa TaxID=3103831 RepID=A0AAP0DCE0_9ASTR
MDFKALKWQMIRVAQARRLILACLCFVLVLFIVSIARMTIEIGTNEPVLLNLDKCSLDIEFIEFNGYEGGKNLTVSVVKQLMNKEMLTFDAKTLCLGENSNSDLLALEELGFTETFGVRKNPIFSYLLRKGYPYPDNDLDFETNSLDFVLSRTVDRVPVPARLVLEIERVLRPGGIGAMLVGFSAFHMGSLVRSATPVSLLLRTSEIHHVCGIGSLALIVFKKKTDDVECFKDYRLPSECPSVSENKPYMQHIEPLVGQKFVSYLPKFVDVSLRNKLVYINMGTGELAPDYPIDRTRFDAYVVDHNVSALSYNVKKPGVTFVYHPGLLENNTRAPSVNHGDYLEAPLHEKPFEFINWFKETAKDGDFVVLMMNAGVTQLKVLFELFESGAICHVDEMFIRCDDGVDCGNSRCNDCLSLFRGLRNAGVFVHRWLGV